MVHVLFPSRLARAPHTPREDDCLPLGNRCLEDDWLLDWKCRSSRWSSRSCPHRHRNCTLGQPGCGRVRIEHEYKLTSCTHTHTPDMLPFVPLTPSTSHLPRSPLTAALIPAAHRNLLGQSRPFLRGGSSKVARRTPHPLERSTPDE